MKIICRYLLLFVVFSFFAIDAHADESTASDESSLTRDDVIIKELQAAIDQARVEGTEQSQENFYSVHNQVTAEIKQKSNIDELGIQEDISDPSIHYSEETTQESFSKKADKIDADVPSPKFNEGPLEIVEEAPNPTDVRSRLKKIELALQIASYNYNANQNFNGDEFEKRGTLYGTHSSYTLRRLYTAAVHTWGDLKYAANNAPMLPTFMRIESDLLFGEVNYTTNTTGKLKGKDAWSGNIRFLAGYDFLSQDSTFMVTPYTGLGYRRFTDDAGGYEPLLVGDYAAYDTIYSFLYMPIGIETLKQINDDWDFGFKLEGTIILYGTTEFKLADISGQFMAIDTSTGLPVVVTPEDSTVDLKGGFGLKSSGKIIRKFEKFDLFTEPYIELWFINQSEKDSAHANGVTNGKNYVSVDKDLYEPWNYTIQGGMRLGVQF